MTDDDLPFYSEHARAMQGSTAGKIKAILAQHAIEYDRENKEFICKPILQADGKPYNSTTYRLKSHKAFGFSCSCQGWTTKFNKHMADPINAAAPGCSHVAALYEFLKRQHQYVVAEKVYGGMQTIFGVEW